MSARSRSAAAVANSSTRESTHWSSLAMLLASWLSLLAAAAYGAIGGVAEWQPNVAALLFVWLLLAPVAWRGVAGRGDGEKPKPPTEPQHAAFIGNDPRVWAGLAAATAFAMHAAVGWLLGSLPPAYHDEFSYLFQAKTFLAGRTSFASSPVLPELFDQMHVLNEGRMASRYFPGTGLFLAPFVAIDFPILGHWLAGAVTAAFAALIAWELGGPFAGRAAGLLTAVSPGIATFGNLLLAHHPTLAALMVFVWAMIRAARSHSLPHLLIAGIALTAAMICRPATAAGIGLPFGIWSFWTLCGGRRAAEAPRPFRRRLLEAACLGGPLAVGFAGLAVYNASITGSASVSPYQLYTDIYTPRHVYGFNNVVRGEQRLGPKVLDDYDRWAVNLTPELAAETALVRLVSSAVWTLDPAILMAGLLGLCAFAASIDSRTWSIAGAIASLHAIHIPYWYAGIMGYHYVFEAAPLWLILVGVTGAAAIRRTGPMFAYWLMAGFALAAWGATFACPGAWPGRLDRAVEQIRFPKRQIAEFQLAMRMAKPKVPALVLIDQGAQNPHLDFVVNSPGLTEPIIYGRYRPGRTDLRQVVRDFPQRAVYLCRPEARQIDRVKFD